MFSLEANQGTDCLEGATSWTRRRSVVLKVIAMQKDLTPAMVERE